MLALAAPGLDAAAAPRYCRASDDRLASTCRLARSLPDHSSFSDVVELLHPCRLTETQLLEQCLMRRTRHSGPGGQHRNKVETAIEIVHEPTGVTAFAAERRSQGANRQVAVFRLRLLLAIRVRSTNSSEVQPTELWMGRCRNQKIGCSERHDEFPVMLAEALDAIDATEFDVRKAAAALCCSSSQLVRFIARAPEALAAVNAGRAVRGLHRLQP